MPTLWIVPTPIGNMDDITLRALQVLKDAATILAEDTRHTGKLLKKHNIDTPLLAYHQHNEHKITESIVSRIEGGETMALVSDAGTPGISDAGFLIIRECIRLGVEVQCLPGATAFVPALINSGFPMDRFVFEGFLPPKKGRQKRLTELSDETRSLIFYESPHRLLKTLGQLGEVFSLERPASISRELTKLHEETVRGTLDDLIKHFSNASIKGEFVIILKGK